MPAISATVVPDPGYVYVEASAADVAGATNICVERVDSLTGDRSSLRPYVAFDGSGCLELSCGQAIFWDTEIPLDRAFTYCATLSDALGNTLTQPAPYLFQDLFDRTVGAGGWGTATSGQTYTVMGVAANYSVSANQGSISLVNLALRATYTGGPWLNVELSGQVRPEVVATGGPFDLGYQARANAGANNSYEALVRFEVGGTTRLRVNRVNAGVPTLLADIALPYTYTAASNFTIVLNTWGNRIRARAFDTTTPDPMVFVADVVDPTPLLTSGQVGAAARVSGTNTNPTWTGHWDNIFVTDVCAGPVAIEFCSGEVIVPSGGCFRLSDPVRPCNDRVVCLHGDDCDPEGGIFFGSMSREEYADNTGRFAPTNASRFIAVDRNRMDKNSTLTLVTATFTDRDDVLALNAPGSVLLWRGPAEYGIADTYMSVGPVTVDPSFLDLREQPRVIAMPFGAEDAPVGPSQGICGARVEDLCDVYPTWDAITAAGLTWADLLRGRAGTGPQPTLATWSDVNADFANWTALNANEANWDDTWRGFP